MVEDKLVLFSLVDEKKRLEAERALLLDEYNKAVFEDAEQLQKVDQALMQNQMALNNVVVGIRATKGRNDIETVKQWGKEYKNK